MIISKLIDDKQTIGDIVMHDVNIKEKTKANIKFLALSLFSRI